MAQKPTRLTNKMRIIAQAKKILFTHTALSEQDLFEKINEHMNFNIRSDLFLNNFKGSDDFEIESFGKAGVFISLSSLSAKQRFEATIFEVAKTLEKMGLLTAA